jgi:pyridoxal phosphate enzyme (YggS family)
MNHIAENILHLKKRIDATASEYGRDESGIHLVAVSKQQPDERIDAALAAGQRLFGENRVQEAAARWIPRRPHYPDLKLHLIGPLQTNKVRDAVTLFDVIETLDRVKLADALKSEMLRQNKNLPCFIQVNTGAEDQKAGAAPGDIPALLGHCRAIGLDVTGLMCIPPVDEPPALHFALLRKIAADMGLNDLSMGMSADFEKAIPLGATHIRLGTALFGEREK